MYASEIAGFVQSNVVHLTGIPVEGVRHAAVMVGDAKNGDGDIAANQDRFNKTEMLSSSL